MLANKKKPAKQKPDTKTGLWHRSLADVTLGDGAL